MSVHILDVPEFLALHDQTQMVMFDTRSESEYAHAHFPGSVNLPLLRDDERKITGTIYKQQGRNEAVLAGFELVGPRFHILIKNAISMAPGRRVMMYCWRGGLRSNIMAWLLANNGFEVYVLAGGYKSFRNYVLENNSREHAFIVLGGPTGSGKTAILEQLEQDGAQVLHLEKLACHKGSAFGGIGQPSQPSAEHFENQVAMALSRFNESQPIWVENESRFIGSCMLPEGIYRAIRNGPLIHLDMERSYRFGKILEEYGCFDISELIKATEKIKKRLGPQHVKMAVEHLQNGNKEKWLEIILDYYDKLYDYGNGLREPANIFRLTLTDDDPHLRAGKVKQFAGQVLSQTRSVLS